MYCQISSSVQLDNGNTRMLSPGAFLPLYRFQSSGRWFFGSQRWFSERKEKTLSLKEKVNLIDNEIRQLYEFCTKAGYTQPQIEQCAQPLISLQSRERHIKWFRRLFSFAVLVAVIAFLFAYDPAYRQICIYGKFIAMKVK